MHTSIFYCSYCLLTVSYATCYIYVFWAYSWAPVLSSGAVLPTGSTLISMLLPVLLFSKDIGKFEQFLFMVVLHLKYHVYDEIKYKLDVN